MSDRVSIEARWQGATGFWFRRVRIDGRLVGRIYRVGLDTCTFQSFDGRRFHDTMSPQDYATALDAALGFCEALINDPASDRLLGETR